MRLGTQGIFKPRAPVRAHTFKHSAAERTE
jgi:hypothetical protein